MSAMARTASDKIRVIRFDRDGDVTPTTRRLVSAEEVKLIRLWCKTKRVPLADASVLLTPGRLVAMRAVAETQSAPADG